MKLIRPINTKGTSPVVTSPFSSLHFGVDYGYPEGESVYAAADGTISYAKFTETRQWLANTWSDPFKPAGWPLTRRNLMTEDYGNMVKIVHSEGYSSIYAHLLPRQRVATGTTVKQGQLIGYVGSTGNSSGNHLHWEPRLNERAIDPSGIMDTTFTNYFEITQPQPAPPMADLGQKASFADKIVIKDQGPQVDSGKFIANLFLTNHVDEYVQEVENRKQAKGRLDAVVRELGYTGDTNTLTKEDILLLMRNKYDPAATRKRTKQDCIDAIQALS